MVTLTGLDVCIREDWRRFQGKSLGVVCHQASIARDYRHILDHMLPHHTAGTYQIAVAFGPQHGIWGHTQDNMIEWEGYTDQRTGLKFASLYGEHREPTDAMLEGVEELLFDVQDVGARYYTFIWTLSLCMKACVRRGIPITVLDRPNPIGLTQVEGPGADPAFASFVGLHPLPVRHGLTVGEVALWLKDHHYPEAEVRLIACERYHGGMMWRETGLPWAVPSPNMPTADTALPYPGMCLLEATNLSEGRGTTRPFEFFGAPYLDGWTLADALNALNLPGVAFRGVAFQPTFQKHAGQICQGAFLHVTNERTFAPVFTTVALLHTVRQMVGDAFRWNDPPYEYEYIKLPIDILWGGSWLREMIDAGAPLTQIHERMESSVADLKAAREEVLIYPRG